jgi:hypothetical protein
MGGEAHAKETQNHDGIEKKTVHEMKNERGRKSVTSFLQLQRTENGPKGSPRSKDSERDEFKSDQAHERTTTRETQRERERGARGKNIHLRRV